MNEILHILGGYYIVFYPFTKLFGETYGAALPKGLFTTFDVWVWSDQSVFCLKRGVPESVPTVGLGEVLLNEGSNCIVGGNEHTTVDLIDFKSDLSELCLI